MKSLIRRKKYQSYQDEQGKIATNVLHREFKANNPKQKWVTDLYHQKIISDELSEHEVLSMLKKAFKTTKNSKDFILYSDQACQYQMK